MSFVRAAHTADVTIQGTSVDLHAGQWSTWVPLEFRINWLVRVRGMAQLFLARIHSEGWTPTAVWLTHAHLDHVAGVAAVKAATGVPVLLHPADRSLYDHVPEQGAMFGLLSADR